MLSTQPRNTALLRNNEGNLAIIAALVFAVIIIVAGGAIDASMAYVERRHMQEALDAAVLAATKEDDAARRRTKAISVLDANLAGFKAELALAESQPTSMGAKTALGLEKNADGSITGTLRRPQTNIFLGILGLDEFSLAVKSTAIAIASAGGPCITVLGSSGQDVLINSGANVKSDKCEMHVHSTANPAFIMNSGSTISLAKFCVKGKNYIKNGGTLSNLETGCSVAADPYAGKFAEPTVSSTCTTSGYFNSSTVTMQPGVHCATGFNGTPTFTFAPGLHIIKGMMVINSGATVIADGVTFYFPDTSSEIRANGSLKFTATAPTSGTYKGVLMFEKTSNASNNANKTQYIFNGSKGETLKGIIYLPNRNVTYNSTTNVTAQISMVVNQIIMNSASWTIAPFVDSSSTSSGGARLTE